MEIVAITVHQRAPRSACRGFSLIEIMIALGLAGVLFTGIVIFFVSSKQNSVAADGLSRIEETGRGAIQMLSSDIRRAGYLGGNTGRSAITGSLGPSTDTLNCVVDNTWGRMVNQAISGLNDTNAGFACISDSEYLRGDILTLRYAASNPVPVADMEDNAMYLRANTFAGRIFVGKDEASTSNIIDDVNSEDFQLIAHTYYVGPSGRTCSGTAIPSLFRKSLNSSGLPESQELMPGVEHLQFRYREGGRYVDADDVASWANVSAVEVTVLVRTECPETGFTNNRAFAMGDLAPAYTQADAYRRQSFTTMVAIRNRS